MIRTMLRISWLNLVRDRVALVMTFVLPLVFFSVFALVFGGMDDPHGRQVNVALVIEDQGAIGSRIREVFETTPDIRLLTVDATNRDALRELVRQGRADVAVAIPSGFASQLIRQEGKVPQIWMCPNQAHPLAGPLVEGVLQSAALRMLLESLHGASAGHADGAESLLHVHIDHAFAAQGKRPSIAYFAAGIGVMFLLFAVSGRSAVLIEERETGVLTRLMASRLTIGQFLFGRWLFLTLLGAAQVTIMFVWAAVAFGLDLWNVQHLAGFVLVTAASAAAAAALGVLLAVACRSRAQLNGIAAVLILVMSALGGSMFPRFLIPEPIQWVGRFTFNAWAIDGYQKIFWYEYGPLAIVPEVLVLAASCFVLMLAARRVSDFQFAHHIAR